MTLKPPDTANDTFLSVSALRDELDSIAYYASNHPITAAGLQAANDAADLANQMLWIGPVAYNIGTTSIRFTTDVWADPNASITYSGTGNAVIIGNSNGNPLNKLRMFLPRIIKSAKTWASDVGLRVECLFESEIWVPHIQTFAVGLDIVGGPGPSASQGTSYNTFYIGHLDNNQVNNRLKPQSVTAWANQNTFIGGRFSHDTGGVSAGTRHCELVNQAGGSQPNNNTWLSPSLETPAVVEYSILCDGANNQWLNARFEGATASFAKVRFAGVDAARPSKKNLVDGGFDFLNATIETGANVGANEITEVGGRRRLVGGIAAGLLCLANINSITSPSLTIGDSSTLLTGDLTTSYYVALAGSISKYKALADTSSRWEMTHTTGQLVRGSGSSTALTSFLHGSGTPEAVHTAGVGSIYQDRGGVGLNSIYYKSVGSGNTGWLAFQPRYQTVATDAAFTLTPHTTPERTRHTGVLTANRAVTLSTTNAQTGQEFTVTRTGGGAFTLDIGTGPLKSLATNQWCRVTYDGAAWFLSEFGAL